MSKYYKVDDVSRAIIELPNAENGYSGSYDKAEILNAFENLPTIEVSEDCISKAWLEQEIENQTMTVKKDEEYWLGWNNALGKVVELIEDAPSVVPCCDNEKSNKLQQELQQAEVTAEQSSKVGEWQNTIGGIYACSNCKSSFTNIPKDGYWKPMWNYCPHCGAKMKG